MPSAPMVTWARILPLLAAVTPRSRYLKNERRPVTRGAVAGVACASLPGGLIVAGGSVCVCASFITETSTFGLGPRIPRPNSHYRYHDWSRLPILPHVPASAYRAARGAGSVAGRRAQ